MIISSTLLALAVAVTACDLTRHDSVEIDRELPRELSGTEKVIAGASNDFTFQLLHHLAEKDPETSFFASPLSISMAFGMALNGAEGETYTQMRDFFGYQNLTQDEINRSFLSLITLLVDLDDRVTFSIANSIWFKDGYPVLKEFLDTNREYFDAEIRPLDFSDAEAPDIINDWINQKTHGLIEKMIESIGPDVVMYLINAMYFKGDWTIQFDPEKTADAPFYLADGSQIQVPTMHAANEFRHVSNQEWTVLDMWYGKAGYSFTALLPTDSSADINTLVTSLTTENFNTLTSSLKTEEIDVYVPKFEIDYEIEGFTNDLNSMGLTLPFVENLADFSKITNQDQLFISDVLHRAVVKLDEVGTEAAAVTVIEFRITSSGPERPFVRLDRPFLFFIRENTTNTILFMGKYAGN